MKKTPQLSIAAIDPFDGYLPSRDLNSRGQPPSLANATRQLVDVAFAQVPNEKLETSGAASGNGCGWIDGLMDVDGLIGSHFFGPFKKAIFVDFYFLACWDMMILSFVEGCNVISQRSQLKRFVWMEIWNMRTGTSVQFSSILGV